MASQRLSPIHEAPSWRRARVEAIPELLGYNCESESASKKKRAGVAGLTGREKKVCDRSRGDTPTSTSQNFDDPRFGELVEAFKTPALSGLFDL